MPHAVFNLGAQTGTQDSSPRTLVPGVEPGVGLGNIFAQERTKPALLIRDATLQLNNWDEGAYTDPTGLNVFLKLSQEADLSPGLLLLIGGFLNDYNLSSGVGIPVTPLVPHTTFKAQGTVWAPRFVGVRTEEQGNLTWDVDVHLDYEVVEVPWWDWIVMWDFLDNVTDNSREY